MAEIFVPGQHRHVYRNTVPVCKVQVVGRMEFVLPAVSRHGGGHAHAQHTGENGVFAVCVDGPVSRHRVFVHVDVNEAGADDPALCVNDLLRTAFRFSCRRADCRHAPILDQQILLGVHLCGSVDHMAVFDQNPHCV